MASATATPSKSSTTKAAKQPVTPPQPKEPTAAQVAAREKALADFTRVADALAAADAAVQIAGNESKQASAARASLATDALNAAIKAKLDTDTIRATLSKAQVLKGTVSKIVTVASAVQAGKISTADFKSLFEAYTKVSLANRIEKVNAFNAAAAKAGKPLKVVPGTKVGEVAPPVIKEVEKVVMPAPKDALAVILKDIREAGDDDMILDRASYWVTELTSQITAITSKIGNAD